MLGSCCEYMEIKCNALEMSESETDGDCDMAICESSSKVQKPQDTVNSCDAKSDSCEIVIRTKISSIK